MSLGAAKAALLGAAGAGGADSIAGLLYMWGDSSYDVFGTATAAHLTVPTQVPNTDLYTKVLTVGTTAVHYSYTVRTMALRQDGTLFGWGQNLTGALGIGTTTSAPTPTQVGAVGEWADIGAEGELSIGVKKDGTLWVWGELSGVAGGLDGTVNSSTVPIQVGVAADWVACDAYDNSIASNNRGCFFALKADGTLWSWGAGGFYRLGSGSLTNTTTPAQRLTDVSKFSVGFTGGLAIKTDGTLWLWGTNSDGSSLGANKPTPVQVDAGSWVAVTTGYKTCLAIKDDGTLWSWGDGASYVTAQGVATDLAIITQVGADTDWMAVKAGSGQVLALKTDGSLWSCGGNSDYQLGDGTTTTRTTLAQVHAGPFLSLAEIGAANQGATVVHVAAIHAV